MSKGLTGRGRQVTIDIVFHPLPRVLVVGFGPFGNVRDNPSACLSRAIDGQQCAGLQLIGREISVGYDQGIEETLALINAFTPIAVIGVGVAVGRTEVCVERLGRRAADPQLADVYGQHLKDLELGGPDLVQSSAPNTALATALGARLSDDAGSYVCNAWIYRVVRAVGGTLPVAFLHIPMTGLSEESLIQAIMKVWGTPSFDVKKGLG